MILVINKIKLIIFILCFFIFSTSLYGSDWSNVRYNQKNNYIYIESQYNSIIEIKQGGKKVFSECITSLTKEIDLKNMVKKGKFYIYMIPVYYKKASSFGTQGTGLGDLLDPRGISVDEYGRIAVVDSGNDRIQIFNSSMKPLFEFGGFNWNEEDTSFNYISNSNRGSFNVPIDIACTIKDIFVTDRDNNRVKKFDRDGNFLLSFGGQGNQRGRVSYPLGIDTDLMGDVYVADSRNDRIQKFDINGNFIMEIGSFGYTDGKLNNPVDLVVDTDGKIYVLDSGNSRIEVFERYGHYIDEISIDKKGRFDSIDLIRDEVILVTDNKNGNLLFYSKNGEILDVIGKLNRPSGVSVGKDGTIYVVESGESQITKFTLQKKEEKWKFEK